ncbi:hypothetical protein NEUTE1DRAFT_112166 [Neurospora tetrasperma FGSC 2508]|uniref:Uncharacterized protein n=1 Tax=Neurospora tetrasperma (strain FGSC 2508 / ATCC MYA-4615 / P0657) TaxID=510951 RepID=F8MUI4_NEUT8|nr:uncharacterized protein NEUTE1DRAFT_112166 [Neurospora tetrasperma FGSC 2508]EGO55666.1 hypothetical protein NEUTE1DRAFT_112166 [Neurospora tetrasperma FGSC 2508]EGZ69086.1 hypothetical protein NEUTE2DRAFT_140741 [Neurospora tetrasperma FGSC 2509]
MFRANEKGTRTSMVRTTPVPYQQNQERGQSHQLNYHIIGECFQVFLSNITATFFGWEESNDHGSIYPLEGTLIPSKVDQDSEHTSATGHLAYPKSLQHLQRYLYTHLPGTFYVNTLTSVHFFSIVTADSRRSRDQRRSRRELRVCPAVSRRHLDRFIWLYEDTVWVHDADIEREISVDPSVDDKEQPTGGQDELWAVDRHDTTTQEIAIMDAVASPSTSAGPSIKTETTVTPSISTSTGAGATTQPKSPIPAKPDMSIHLAPDQD